ncbi:MAG: chromate transporter [Deltaproteobacteria bacterium]|nr:chromate transporter [Deltaproteobacteria bacterium]
MNEFEVAISMDDAQKQLMPDDIPPVKLRHIAQTFLGIGLASFSLAALGEAKNWMTKKRKWFTDDEYMQGLGLAQLLPGAPTVNLTSYLGFRLRGLPGAAAATFFFLIPCFLLMLLLSHCYLRYGAMPVVSGLFRGLGALVVGLVFNTILNLWRSGVRTIFNRVTAIAGFAMVFWFKMGIMNILLITGGAGLIMVLLTRRFTGLSRLTETWTSPTKSRTTSAGPARANGKQTHGSVEPDYVSSCSRVDLPLHWRKMTLLIFWLALILAVDLALIHMRPELMQMGGSFLRIGALTFGSGYAMLPFIQDSVVTQFGWLTNREFAAALALSLITPGPGDDYRRLYRLQGGGPSRSGRRYGEHVFSGLGHDDAGGRTIRQSRSGGPRQTSDKRDRGGLYRDSRGGPAQALRGYAG